MSLRNFVFTVNNPEFETVNRLKGWDQIKYIVCGSEVGESGTPHLQGYVELKASKPFKTIKNVMPTAHIEARRGTAAQAADYCKKDGDYWELGTISKQGARTDIREATALIQEGRRMRDIALECPEVYVKYHRGLEKYQALLMEPRNEAPTVTVLYGPTGTGKSRRARELLQGPGYVWHPQQGQWFDGYQGEDDVIFEEFRGQLPFGQVLSLLDRYDCRVQFKGGCCEFRATNIVLTSPVHPREWYRDIGDDKVDQLMRRITTVECTSAEVEW